MLTQRDNLVTSSPGLAIATTTTAFQIARAFDSIIDGRTVRKAATDNIAFAAKAGTSFTNLAAGQITCFFLLMNAAGAVVAQQAAVVARPGTNTYQPGVWEWPTDETGFVVIGAITVRTNASATFTPGTTALSAANVVTVYIDASGDYGVPIAY